jgi:hypothetical protein
MERPSKSLKKTASKKSKKTADVGKTKKPKDAGKTKKPIKTSDAGQITKKPKAVPSRKVSSGKTIRPKKDLVTPQIEAESQHRYFEDLSSRLAKKAYELYVQRGQEHGHDIEDWLEAERQILPKEISERA